MCKKLILLMAVALVLGVALPALASAPAGLTAYWSYNSSFEPDFAVEPGLALQDQGGAPVIDPAGGVLMAGFGGGLAMNLGSGDALAYWGSDYTQTLNSAQGTIEFWIAPSWNGTNQGGGGVGAPGSGAAAIAVCVGRAA